MLKVISLSLMSLAFAACAVDPTVPEETGGEQLAIPDELQLDLGEDGVEGRPYNQSYCVDQSYASANRVTCEWFPSICSQPNYDTALSRDHRVRMQWGTCGTYVHVYSLWNGACYHMRRDALRPC
jgi:hypothetical protein